MLADKAIKEIAAAGMIPVVTSEGHLCLNYKTADNKYS